MTLPEHIKDYVKRTQAPHYVDMITNDLIAAMAGNRPATTWEENAIKEIMSERA